VFGNPIGDTSPVRDFTFVEDTVEAFVTIGASSNIEFGRHTMPAAAPP